ncbi:hypothetical protein FSARC_6913 [Fusarium sarcochroum]|uniref:ARCA protein n=1 Tax=Fusarium sarcochroum TaxID=1208366 RepID=A0A8H4TW46_9HYPO|nr:hypothetical protein FSARC_6913 [Fusarium sarcochroum]
MRLGYTESRGKVSDLPSSTDLVWTPSPRRLRFVDETHDIEAHYLSDPGSPLQNDQDDTFQPHDDSLVDPGSASSPTPQVDVVETRAGISHVLANKETRRNYSPVPPGSSLGLASAGSVPYPLTESHEVWLMKYYLEYMCTWFDLCDSRRHFANVVPPRAATCPTLLNAIFALSSRHLSLNAQYDPYAADRYHQECLKHLTTISSNSLALNDDNLLAATILLRTLEELDVPLLGTDHEGHLLGIQLFMNTSDSAISPSSLRQASFWIGLRQEIYMSFVGQRPVKIKLDHEFIDRSFSPADDDTNSGRSRHRYQELVNYDQAWLRARPVSWLPIAYSAPDESLGEVCPHVIYLNHAVVIGLVHSIFARILLMCHDDWAPRIGPSAQLARRQIDDDIRTQVRELCGIALSNPSTRPATFTACMGVTACGDRFTDEKDQKALLDVLIVTENIHSWPTAAAQAHLKKAWGWDEGAC